MLKFKLLFALFIVVLISGFNSESKAQSEPVMYFCERYDDVLGEVDISDRFYPGYLTVMVKAATAMGLSEVSIQFDKYDCRTGSFNFYKKFNYTVSPDMKYVYFARNAESDMSFDDVGIYRVFLLNSSNKTVASALIEIIPR
jgi:hypothetical protein